MIKPIIIFSLFSFLKKADSLSILFLIFVKISDKLFDSCYFNLNSFQPEPNSNSP